MIYRKRITGYHHGYICLVWLLIMCLCVSCTPGGSSEDPTESLSATEAVTVPVTEAPNTEAPDTEAPATEAPDTEGPVISGVQPLTATVGGAVSYRDGVTAVDDRDGPVMLQVDSSQVDLNAPGEYEVIYSAEDSSGNRTEVTTTVVVTEPDPVPSSEGTGPDPVPTETVTLESVNALADQILARIITDGMSQREKAKAIYDYVYGHIKYVGSSDKSSWIVGAHTGFTTGRGDCYNYFACSKVLLTRAGIPNVDLERVGGTTHHYWNLVDVGEGYYHFDTCPHPTGYSMNSFLFTEAQARAYTERVSPVRKNYYVYDYASCPVPVAGLSEEERNPQGTAAEESVSETTPESAAQPEGQEG